MLKRQSRLVLPVRLISPTSLTTPAFSLKVAPNNLPLSRFGFIVRKAIDKRSSQRNKVKRIFRSCIEELLGQIKEGYDMIFIVQRGSIEMERDELYKEIETGLRKKNLLQ